jgi:hypothetical protein
VTDLVQFAELVALDHGLSVVVTLRRDHTPHTTVVNAGVVPHPATGALAVAFVAAGGTRKLAHLRTDPTIAVVVRAGWQWVAVEAAPSSSDRTTATPAWTTSSSGSCFAPCSARRAGPTTIGQPSTM